MAEQEPKKPPSVKPKKTSAVSETGERRIVLSAKADPLQFLQEEQEKLNEEIIKGQETEKELQAKLTKKEETPAEFTVSKSRRDANREADLLQSL